jgi:hypothetical protein
LNSRERSISTTIGERQTSTTDSTSYAYAELATAPDVPWTSLVASDAEATTGMLRPVA